MGEGEAGRCSGVWWESVLTSGLEGGGFGEGMCMVGWESDGALFPR